MSNFQDETEENLQIPNDSVSFKDTPLKIFHGPVDICGIGRYLADWQRKKGAISDFITFQDNPLMSSSHFCLRGYEYGFIQRTIMFVTFFFFCLIRYDVFHFYFGKTLLPLNLDLPILRLFGKKIVMTYCGSDIRLIEIEKIRNPYHRLVRSSQDGPEFDAKKKIMMRWHKIWIHRVFAPRNAYAFANEIFPDRQIIKNLWIHNLMDMEAYSPSDFSTKKVPVLVHAPSDKGIKGTDYVESAINKLKRAGYQFEYIRVTGLSNSDAREIYKNRADIIIDQFIFGGFGTLAVEGMYYGKPVVCYLIDEVKSEHYPDVPIVNASIDNIQEKLAWLIDNPEDRVRLGREGRAFVERHCSNEKVNAMVWDLYQRL